MKNIKLISQNLQQKLDNEKLKSFERFYVKDKKLGEGQHAQVFKCFKIEDTLKIKPYAVKVTREDDEEK